MPPAAPPTEDEERAVRRAQLFLKRPVVLAVETLKPELAHKRVPQDNPGPRTYSPLDMHQGTAKLAEASSSEDSLASAECTVPQDLMQVGYTGVA